MNEVATGRPASCAPSGAGSHLWPFLGLASLVVALAMGLGGAPGLAYIALVVTGTLPGLPVGFALFGRRHAAGWIGGALLGYAMSMVALWVPMALGPASPRASPRVWALVTTARGWRWAAGATPRRRASGLVTPRYGRAVPRACDGAGAGRPYRFSDRLRVTRGRPAVSRVLHRRLPVARRADAGTPAPPLPPLDPYASPRRCTTTGRTSWSPPPPSALLRAPSRLDVQAALAINALAAGLLFVGLVFMFAWASCPAPVRRRRRRCSRCSPQAPRGCTRSWTICRARPTAGALARTEHRRDHARGSSAG